ncbi:conserved Plasmodium protein, unknown function [Plasmodium gallinaceum]|uniref:Uncharacterized protein n=1 Tax=Plasmodium gallinaceum TaxID=5849 RepID=A0A1J1GKW8_PLAGA|nr:conserved Plasmodium protein, unknown function [Plasmodium gallinaceum]CRG93056.1 conserved Plasmodium protein, unknown function [Plasmodium gallinaceum]
MISVVKRLVCCVLLCVIVVSSFNFNNEIKQKNYLVLQKAYIDCKNYNVVNNKNKNLSINYGELYCNEDPFCQYFLFNNKKKEIRLCYDKKIVLKKPKYDHLWLTSIKVKVFENFSPCLVNTQGICNHKVDKFFFNTLNEAIKKRKEIKENFMILNFQPKEKEKKIEAYFCETIDYFVDREGYVVFDFIKIKNPHQSCLRTQKCSLRGSIQLDDSKHDKGINPGDIVEAHKF